MNVVQTVLAVLCEIHPAARSHERHSDGFHFHHRYHRIIRLWNWVSKKLDKRKSYALGISFWALAQLLLDHFESSSSTIFVLYCAL